MYTVVHRSFRIRLYLFSEKADGVSCYLENHNLGISRKPREWGSVTYPNMGYSSRADSLVERDLEVSVLCRLLSSLGLRREGRVVAFLG